MELGIREWMIIIGVLLLIAVLLDGIRKMREERRNHIRVAFKMGGGVCDEDNYVDPVDREVSKPRVISPNLERVDAKATAKPRTVSAPSKRKNQSRKSVPEKIQETTASLTASLSMSDEGVPEAERIEPDLGEAISFQEAESANEEPRRSAFASESNSTGDTRAPANTEENAAPSAKKVKRNAARAPANLKEPKPAAEIKEFQPSNKQSVSQHGALDYQLVDEFLSVYVVAKDEQGFNGADLLQVLLACDLRFGKRNIFHRHEYKNGTGPVQFSMANIVEPGVFDLNTIETFQTPGVCFFMSLPGPEDPLKAFDYMVETANCIVRNLNGDLKDEAHSAMTTQTLSHNRQRVQEFERRQLTMSAK